MRSTVSLFLLTALVAPAIAQAEVPPKHRISWEERFVLANTTQDGQLTLAQAKAGYPLVARRFADIDKGSKGFVTADDLRAWHKAQNAARHLGHAKPEDPLRPRPAYQRMLIDERQVKASTDQVVKLPHETPAAEARPAE